MQTFLPYPDFKASLRTLDRQRLGKQRVETLQVVQTLRGLSKNGGWKNHPAVKMWKGHENALVRYGITACILWRARGYKDTCAEKLGRLWDPAQPVTLPDWIGDSQFHASHRSNLLRKDAAHYGQFGWAEPDDLPYFWPV